jgi:hypothetical protein
MNLPVSEIGTVSSGDIPNISSIWSATEIGRRFLRTMPDYPIISITISPLEGYLAPTENMIHDASTMRMVDHDVSLVIHGQYRFLHET